MNVLHTAIVMAGNRIPAAEYGIDDQGYTSHHWLLPEQAEIIYGSISFAVLVLLALKFKVPAMVKKAFADRTAKIQAELDSSANAERDAEAEAARIRQSLGNIEAERHRLLADADTQATNVLTDGRARLELEVSELEAKADADIASGANRSTDELRAEISRLASAAADRVVEHSLDDATLQQLIEDYIAKVGATSPQGARG